jgi:uncharacterized membrane protein (UPF0182 family)
MLKLYRSLSRRLCAVFDKSALILMLPTAAALFFIDPPMIKTLLQWVLYAPFLVGVAIIVCRIVFPQIELTKLIRGAENGNTAAGLVASSIIVFVAVIVVALVSWAKA